MIKKITLIFFISMIISLSFFLSSFAEDETIAYEEEETQTTPELVRARVVRVLSTEKNKIEYSGGNLSSDSQYVEVLITNGKYKDTIVKAEHSLNFAFSDVQTGIILKPGNNVILFIEEAEDGSISNVYVAEIVRDKYLIYLVISFLILLVVVGGLKGLKSAISLIITCFAIVSILLPLILKGHNPIILSVLVCTFVIVITLLIVSGFNKKTTAAIIGTVGGIISAGIIALIVGSITKLTGLGEQEAQMLIYIPQSIEFNFKGLLFSGIIIGALGAIMDVGISIASSMYEIMEANPTISKVNLIRSGMNIGKDIMGTMSNTLILAYTGGSIHMMLLFMAYEIPLFDILNRDMIASEVVRAFAGSIGLIFTIPITAITAGFLYEKNISKKSYSHFFTSDGY